MADTEKIREFSFKNDTGHTVPPFGCLIVTDTTDEANEVTYEVRRANYDDEQEQDPAKIVFNLGEYVEDGSWGRCSSSFPLQALCDSTVVIGNIVGPVEDSFVMGPNGNAFVVKAKDDTAPHVEGTSEVWLVEPNVAEVVVVEITSTTLDADGYYPGEVKRYDPATDTWTTVRTCRVKDINT